ncbi:hypothetical protein BCR32DRAFT_96230 [Anaeromyces robustus]|uniref:Anaphase-promoting complex subunit 2 n=1 Tax=Anaeromyces robustus TaxID=1754192 RepID=A0A1Y1XIV1_9FUNG|nr:hypothetical protein BCR32DRAFT_96230 [Anaeromyces robustus]|eukprot:ORX85316.1 hypothetical protein BCR32DRAFT_96230 [Anaeromyces robustus]
MSKDSLIIDTEKEKGRDKDKDKDDISMNESIEDQNMDEDENEGNEDNKKNEDENEDIEMKDSNENSSDSSNSESESSDDNDDYIKEKDNEDNNSNSDDDSSISSEKENEKDKLISDDYDSDMDEDKYETIADDDYVMGTKEFLKQFAINSSNIISDHFLYRYEAIISNVIYRHIKHVILKHNRGVFNQPCLVKSLAWYKCALIPFQKIIWQPNLYPENEKSFISWNARIRYYIYKTYFDIRTSELFDIIVEYPDSKWSLIDLKISIKKTGLIKELISSLNESIKKRLLHQGAKTSDIVHQYISLIKCMQILDSSGLLLEQVSDPIKKYLRYREDTIKCIVQIIADDNNENLLESIPKQDIIAFDEMNLNNYNNDNWMPELLEIDPANEVVKKKSVDIISTLLNIYDSKDVFIKEFQELLANRLLALKSYELKRELRNLELLKLRFGENNLQLCEVMIKDISSSRRIDYNIHTETNFDDNSNNNKNEKDNNKELPFHAKILSHLFWPPFKPNNLKFPKEIQEYADIYSKQYTTLKPSRKLQWLPYLGYVSLTVELEDRTLTFNDLTPIQAIILYHFQEKDQWELNELSNKLEVTPAVVKHGIVFWMNKGIMKEITKDVYKILEKEEDVMIEDEIHNTVEDAEDNIEEQSSKGQDTDQMRIYWTFISNMITNLGGMTIERIHQMLQVCLPNYKSQIEQLRSFLELMIHENKLDLNDDVYTIKK